MRIHEYQAKRLLKEFGVSSPRGALAFSAAEAEAAARFLGGAAWMVKAQIHATGRGQAGLARRAEALGEVAPAARAIIASLAAASRDSSHLRPLRLYVEEAHRPRRELFLAIYVDRVRGCVTLLGAPDGGMSIATAAAARPERLVRLAIDPRSALREAESVDFARRIGAGEAAFEVARAAERLCEAFVSLDAALLEIKPLAILEDGRVMALDARMMLDDNALFRHPALAALRDAGESSADELEAARHEINYVALGGNVGCVVNGAGLGMATLDLLKLRGVEPANFMDIRPVATREQVATGFRIMLADPKLACILVNVFGGGIMRCDKVAEGMVLAARELPIRAPLVVRFAGTDAELGCKLLANSGLGAQLASGLADAAARVARIVTTGGGGSWRRPAAAARA